MRFVFEYVCIDVYSGAWRALRKLMFVFEAFPNCWSPQRQLDSATAAARAHADVDVSRCCDLI